MSDVPPSIPQPGNSRRHPRILLVGPANGYGLSRDLYWVAQALRQTEADVTVWGCTPADERRRRKHGPAAVLRRLGGFRPGRHDAVIHLEHVWPDALPCGRRHILIPNPEWFDRHDRRCRGRLTAMWCKSPAAARWGEILGVPTETIGFTSDDILMPSVARVPTFLHVAGASRTKNTDPLLALWMRHPEWPVLTVVQDPGAATFPFPGAKRRDSMTDDPFANDTDTIHPCPSVRYIRAVFDLRDDDDRRRLRTLQNESLFHLYPSAADAWGHALVEGMACGNILITSDAEPMRGLVAPDRGILLAGHVAGRLHEAAHFHFDEAALEQVVARCRTTAAEDWLPMRWRARAWFEAQAQAFPRRVAVALDRVLTDGSGT